MLGTPKAEQTTTFDTCRRDLPAAFAITAFIFLIAHGRFLFDPFVVNDDVRQQLFWMRSWIDPQLYSPRDILTQFSAQYVSWGVRGLYRLFALFRGDPLIVSKFVAGALYTLMGGAIFGLARRIVGGGSLGRHIGFAALAVFWLHPYFLHNISGGLARAFAGPLLVCLLWAWTADRGRLALLCLVLEALFIPYIFALCAGAFGLAWLWDMTHGKQKALPAGASTINIAAAFAVGGAVTLAFNLALTAAGFGPLISKANMVGRVIFTDAGRLDIFPTPSLFKLALLSPLEKLMPFQVWGPALGGVAAVCFGILLLVTVRKAPWRKAARNSASIAAIVAASLLLYWVSSLVLLKLFLPERYIEYSVHILWCLALGIPLGAATARLATGRNWRVAGAVLVLTLAMLAGARLQGEGLYHYEEYAPLYEAVRRTDKDAVIAGHPSLMDDVLTFGRRRVYATFETSQPWCVGLWDKVEPRLYKIFGAYYSDDAEAIIRMCQEEGIDYLVVDDRNYSPEFLHPAKEYMPLSQALGLPGWASWAAEPIASVAESLGAAKTAPKPPHRSDTYRGGVPFFAPFDEYIVDVVQQAHGQFALLDEERFPGERIGPHQRLIDIRSAAQRAGRSKETK